MFRPKVILQTVLFILIGSFLYSVQSDAQSKGVINPPQKRFEISFGGGWGLYRMTSINKHYIDEVGIFDGHIDNGLNIFGEVGYFVSPNVSANIEVTYLHGANGKKENMFIANGYENQPADTFLEEGSLTTTLVAPELKIKYHFSIEKTDLFLSGGVAWCFGKCVLKSTIKTREQSSSGNSPFTAQGVGFLASTGGWYNLNETISLGAEIGYRHFATGDLKERDNNPDRKVGTAMSLTNYKVNLDFSGPFILGGLRLKL